MVWIILLVCLGVVGMAGYQRGPVCAGFSLVGLLVGIFMAQPLSPLARSILPIFGVQDPIQLLVLPGVIAFLAVLILFKVVGNFLHQKLTFYYKYKQKDEIVFIRWENTYARLGFCIGLINGAVYFFILMMPIYIGGYFVTEAGAADASTTARFVANARASLHDSNLDRILAPHDPIPPQLYQASDILNLVRQNPPLLPRLLRYPPVLTLARQKEIHDLTTDPQVQQLIQNQATIHDLAANDKIQAVLTNAATVKQIAGVLGPDLTDLQEYLNTGKSAKYDNEKILGTWNLDGPATWQAEREANPLFAAHQISEVRSTFIPLIRELNLTATSDNVLVLQRRNPDKVSYTLVSQGTWKSTGDAYELTLPNNKPDKVTVTIGLDGILRFSRDGHTYIFTKDL
jgi:Colicin V production protein